MPFQPAVIPILSSPDKRRAPLAVIRRGAQGAAGQTGRKPRPRVHRFGEEGPAPVSENRYVRRAGGGARRTPDRVDLGGFDPERAARRGRTVRWTDRRGRRPGIDADRRSRHPVSSKGRWFGPRSFGGLLRSFAFDNKPAQPSSGEEVLRLQAKRIFIAVSKQFLLLPRGNEPSSSASAIGVGPAIHSRDVLAEDRRNVPGATKIFNDSLSRV